MVVAYEPETANVLDTTEKAQRLLEIIGSPALGITFDPANFFYPRDLPRMREVLEEGFRRLGQRIALAHAKDVVPPPDGASHSRYAPAGQGRLDYATYLRLLQESGYANGLILHSLSEREIPGCIAHIRAHAPAGPPGARACNRRRNGRRPPFRSRSGEAHRRLDVRGGGTVARSPAGAAGALHHHRRRRRRRGAGERPRGGTMTTLSRQETEIVQTDKAAAPIGPYSQAVVANGFVFVAGEKGLDPATGKIVPGGIAAETRQTLTNIKHILEAAGSSFDRCVQAFVYLTDISEFAAMNEVYAEFFRIKPPGRTTVAVSALPAGARVEITVTALA